MKLGRNPVELVVPEPLGGVQEPNWDRNRPKNKKYYQKWPDLILRGGKGGGPGLRTGITSPKMKKRVLFRVRCRRCAAGEVISIAFIYMRSDHY